MRSENWNMSLAIIGHWLGESAGSENPCPLLADFDRLIAFLDGLVTMPGDTLWPCPACGIDHRWGLLRELMMAALDLRPDIRTALLETVDCGLDEVRRMYGDKEGYAEYLQKAEEYFAKVRASDACKG